MRKIGIATAAALVSACGNSGQPAAQAETTAAALQPGEYELGWSSIKRNTGESKSDAAPGGTEPQFAQRACVAPGGRIDAAAFAEGGDDCKVVQNYVRNGIVNVQLSCQRKGAGKLSTVATGRFTATGLTADVETSTSFAGEGNYTMTRKLTGKRVGDCTATADSADGDSNKES